MAIDTTALREEILSGINNQTDPLSIPQTEVAKVFNMVADLLDQIGQGLTTPFPQWVQGSYGIGERVTRNFAFYESQVNGNTSDPATDTTKWKPIADVTVKPITVELGEGGIVGGLKTGDQINSRTDLQTIVEKLTRRKVSPIYNQPTLTITSTKSNQNLEVGDNITIPLNANFVQNDAGAKITNEITKNGNTLSLLASYTDTVLMNDTQINYRAIVKYGQGDCKNDNLGVQDCAGRIEANILYSNVLTYKAFRNMYWGFGTTPENSSQVRALSNKVFLKEKGQQITINVPTGSQRVIFAYDADWGDVTSVKYIELSNSEIKGIFTKATFMVTGSNDLLPKPYNVMVYTPVEPFTQAVTYLVTI